MSKTTYPVAVQANDVAPRAKRSNYPEPFAAKVAAKPAEFSTS